MQYFCSFCCCEHAYSCMIILLCTLRIIIYPCICLCNPWNMLQHLHIKQTWFSFTITMPFTGTFQTCFQKSFLCHTLKRKDKNRWWEKKKHECTRKLYSLRRLDTDTKQLNVSTQNVFISNTQKEDRLTKKDRRGETVNEMKRR